MVKTFYSYKKVDLVYTFIFFMEVIKGTDTMRKIERLKAKPCESQETSVFATLLHILSNLANDQVNTRHFDNFFCRNLHLVDL